jgi:hypothetical protein
MNGSIRDMAKSQADRAVFRRVRTQARLLIARGIKANRHWTEAATIGDVAHAMKLAPCEVLRLIRGYAWLMAVDEVSGAPVEEWFVWEDGE